MNLVGKFWIIHFVWFIRLKKYKPNQGIKTDLAKILNRIEKIKLNSLKFNGSVQN
jgi:hypothetical protein